MMRLTGPGPQVSTPRDSAKASHDAGSLPLAGPAPAAPLVVVVHGIPAMQGSKRHVGNGRMIEMSKRTRPWRENVRDAAAHAIFLADWHRIDGPVSVRAEFYFDRPASHYRSGQNAHLLKDGAPAFPSNRASGDVDKMLRACFDSLADAGAFRDDAQVVYVTAAKSWTHTESQTTPGARLVVNPW